MSMGDGDDEAASDPTSRRVLVIDDEALVRRTVQTILRRRGIDSVAAEGGREGVEIYEREWQLIDRVILDMRMPDMTGGEVLGALRRINPDAVVLVVSGYSEAQVLEELGEAPTGVILKPFTARSLLEKLRETSDAPL